MSGKSRNGAAPARTGTGKTTTKGQATRARILDAAEAQFLEKGFKTASLRDIATAAGVEQGLISYYFRSKDELLWEAVTRLVGPAFARHQAALDQLLGRCGERTPTVAEILDAYSEAVLGPLAEGNKDLMAILRLSALRGQPGAPRVVAELAERYSTAVRQAYVATLRKALPDQSEVRIEWCFDAFQAVYRSVLMNEWHAARPPSKAQIMHARAYLVPFCTAGFLAPIVDGQA